VDVFISNTPRLITTKLHTPHYKGKRREERHVLARAVVHAASFAQRVEYHIWSESDAITSNVSCLDRLASEDLLNSSVEFIKM